jgi:hypothetical protein
MRTVHEIEQAVEKLSPEEFSELAAWIARRPTQPSAGGGSPLRDHSAFLNSYSPEDEGLYDDASAR